MGIRTKTLKAIRPSGARRAMFACLTTALCMAMTSAIRAAEVDSIPHLERKGSTMQLIVDGKPLLLISGELHNSSSSGREYMAPIWDKLVNMKLNSVIGSLSWELIEPEEGKFEFSGIDDVVKDARSHGLHLVLIWFASWKNGNNDYTPAWVKTNEQRFPHSKNSRGQSLNTMSALGEETMKADARAFAAVMHHLQEIDGTQHTVVTMQVENESGILGEARDHSPLAEEAFKKPVPAELINALKAKKDTLIPEFKQIWSNSGFRESGTWSEVFGTDADEMFMDWNIGHYIGTVAAAGKAQYPIPMYANCWINYESNGTNAGRYPSGGPVAKAINIWQAAAPALDMYAPDIYVNGFRQVATEFHTSGNPLFIPETRGGALGAARSFYAFGEHDAICFAPFGIDSNSVDTPLTTVYQTLGNMMPLIAENQGTGKMHGFFQDNPNNAVETMTLGDYRLSVQYGGTTTGRGGGRGRGAGTATGPATVETATAPVARGGAGGTVETLPGFGVVIALGPEDFLFAGSGYSVSFQPLVPGDKPNVELLSVDEGKVVDGKWIAGRRLNGDERPRSVNIRRMDTAAAGAGPAFLRVKIYRRS